MKLKKSKDEVLSEITNVVYSEVNTTLNNYFYNHNAGDLNLKRLLTESISNGVRVGMKTLIENQYTDDDLERDLSLK